MTEKQPNHSLNNKHGIVFGELPEQQKEYLKEASLAGWPIQKYELAGCWNTLKFNHRPFAENIAYRVDPGSIEKHEQKKKLDHNLNNFEGRLGKDLTENQVDYLARAWAFAGLQLEYYDNEGWQDLIVRKGCVLELDCSSTIRVKPEAILEILHEDPEMNKYGISGKRYHDLTPGEKAYLHLQAEKGAWILIRPHDTYDWQPFFPEKQHSEDYPDHHFKIRTKPVYWYVDDAGVVKLDPMLDTGQRRIRVKNGNRYSNYSDADEAAKKIRDIYGKNLKAETVSEKKEEELIQDIMDFFKDIKIKKQQGRIPDDT